MAELIRWVTFEGTSGSQLFDQLIVTTIEKAKFSKVGEVYAKALSFTNTPILWPNTKYGSMDPGNGLSESGENAKAPELARRFGNTKGIYQKVYKGKITATGLFYDFLRNTKTLEGANSDIQASVLDTGKNMTYVMKQGEKTKAQVMTKVITLGASITSPNWPGSATPDGKALFATDHPIAATGGTQSNIVTGAFTDNATRITRLESAVSQMRNMRLANGDFVYTNITEGSPYILKCPVSDKYNWEKALNGYKVWSGNGSNANQVNMFTVGGYNIIVEELATLGTYDADGVIIGDTTAAYLFNPSYLEEAEALRCYTVHDMSVVTDMVKDPRSFVAIGELAYGADHYGAELGVIKLTGA